MPVDWQRLFNDWYAWLSQLNGALAFPIQDLSDRLNLPLVSALLFGLLGTTAPCQLSTNFGALAFLARRPADRAATLQATFAYIGAKVLVYTLLGLIVLTVGQQLSIAFIPYIQVARKVIGPAMIVLGLAVWGVIRWRWQLGQGLARQLEGRAATGLGTGGRVPLSLRLAPRPVLAPATSSGGAVTIAGSASQTALSAAAPLPPPSVRASFLLGLAFSCAFCPTLFLLFFGVTLTLAARSPGGFVFPAVFALGTAVPLLLFVSLLLTSADAATRFLRRLRQANRPLRWVGGIVLLLLGLHDTFVYWVLG